MSARALQAVSVSGILALVMLTVEVQAGSVDGLLDEYQAQGARDFDAGAGAVLWRQNFGGKSCTSCHAASPRDPGRNERTGKPIKPMAPSVNPQRLTNKQHMKKWLLRNCKSTLGRECTAQEKGDILVWLRGQ